MLSSRTRWDLAINRLSAALAERRRTGAEILDLTLSNPTAEDLEARVLTFYPGAPGRQYGRDVWVPAKATLWSWSCIGPPPGPPERNVVELRSFLYHRTGGREHLLRSPEGQPFHSDLVRFSRRESHRNSAHVHRIRNYEPFKSQLVA